MHKKKRKNRQRVRVVVSFLSNLPMKSVKILIAGAWTLVASFPAALYGQSFDALLNELSGSEADRLESEMENPQKEKNQPLSSIDMTSSSEEDAFAPAKNIVTNGVTLQGLDKQTGRVFIIDAPVGQVIEFGTLKIVAQHCEKTSLEDRQDSMAFMTITEEKPKSPRQSLFSGWMFASSPALSALDHPVYDVWIKACKSLN